MNFQIFPARLDSLLVMAGEGAPDKLTGNAIRGEDSTLESRATIPAGT